MDSLTELYNFYGVPISSRKTDLIATIRLWSELKSPVKGDPIANLLLGNPFELTSENISILKKKFPNLGIQVFSDFSKYPATKVNGLSEYLKSVVMSERPKESFSKVEEIFINTHDYGRPDPNMSYQNMILKNLIKESTSTSLTIFGVFSQTCLENQNVGLILNLLSTINLSELNQRYFDMLQRINKAINSDHPVKNYRRLLKQFGILDNLQYDPKQNLYKSNAVSFLKYTNVNPARAFDFSNIITATNTEEINNYLDTLSDIELISVRINEKSISDEYRLNKSSNWKPQFIRERIIKRLVGMLKKTYFSIDQADISIFCPLTGTRTVSKSQLISNFDQKHALFDGEEFFGIDEIDDILNLELADDERAVVELEISRAKTVFMQYQNYITSMESSQRKLIKGLLKKIINENFDAFDYLDIIGDLMMYKILCLGDTVPIGITFNQYYKKFQPDRSFLNMSLLKNIEFLTQIP